MHIRTILMLGCCALLGACSPSRNDNAANACNAEITRRMNGRSFALDLKDLAAHVKQEAPDTLLLTSTVVLDQGLPSQDKQTYECRVRFDAQGNASVLFLQFNWNTSDLKQAQ